MERGRPDPDELLRHVEAQERRGGLGRLRIFLGYAAGVGKTYAMLEAARARAAEGVDVVVGLVETHGRSETERLLEGLEILPRKTVEYREAALAELDLDGLLSRSPELALVDELAHTNAPGSRHNKRYLDVTELREAGIDVFTTLNVQHVESLTDVVAQITGVRVRETVPDQVVQEATEIELVDLPPEELLIRLREGKVYVPDQATRAVERFFRPGNLSALREMALRRTAQQVDAQMLSYMQTQAITGPWPAGERLLVAVGPSPLSERLVRAAKRLADEIKAEWLAIYVETPDIAGHEELAEAARHNLTVAERLGAKVITMSGSSVPDTLVDYAKRHNVTKIVAGKPLKPRWQELLRGPVVDRIIRDSGDIDVYVINSGAQPIDGQPRPRARGGGRPVPYLLSGLAVALATIAGLPLTNWVSPANVVMLYLAAVVVVSVFLGRGPAIATAFLSVLAFDFFLVPPRLTLAVSDTEYLLTFAGLFIVGLVVSTLASRVRAQAASSRRRELQTSELYDLSRELAGAATIETITQVVRAHLEQLFGGRVAILLWDGQELRLAPGSAVVEEEERAIASWVVEHGQQAGRGTATLPGASFIFLPMRAWRGIIGVLGIEMAAPSGDLSVVARRAPEAFATLAALSLERAELAQAANVRHLAKATEELQSALLDSISHELRTPLASIAGALSSLREPVATRSDGGASAGESAAQTPGPGLTPASQAELIQTAWEEAERLNRMVGTLLDMTRLEAGAMQVIRETVDLEEAVGAALFQLEESLEDRPLRTDIPDDLPAVPGDAVLLVHALVNVLHNALKYSPRGSPIDVRARVAPGEVRLSVADRGTGIPAGELAAVFEKFYRLRPDQGAGERRTPGGLGLGLSISRGIVEAHHGRIWAENRPGGGTRVTIALPAGFEGSQE